MHRAGEGLRSLTFRGEGDEGMCLSMSCSVEPLDTKAPSVVKEVRLHGEATQAGSDRGLRGTKGVEFMKRAVLPKSPAHRWALGPEKAP